MQINRPRGDVPSMEQSLLVAHRAHLITERTPVNMSESSAARLQDAFLLSSLGWQHLFQNWAQEFQVAQLRAMGQWTGTLAFLYQDAWDRWIARFGGGVPLDG